MVILRRIAVTVLAVCTAGPAVPAPAGSAAESERGRLGTNLAAITYYDGAMIFSDLVKQAGEWIPQRHDGAWGSGAPLELRVDGWPRRLADDQFATAVLAEGHYPAGRYTVSWRGSGTFDVAGNSFSGSAGDGQVDLDGSSIVLLNIRRTDIDDPLRDIAVRAPGVPADSLFHPDYLAQLSPYSVVRFMDWQRTNSTFGDPKRSFRCDGRVTPGYYSQGTRAGAAAEVMVALANVTDTDPWFTVPHEATADWVRCHARVVATTLAPHLVPRYEFSNETWNPTFRSFHDLMDEARAAGLGGGDAFLGLQRRVGQRHNEIMDLVGDEMAAVRRPFVRVLAGQAANSWVLEQRLATPGTAGRTDEIAIAPYLGVGGNPFDTAEASRLAELDPAAVIDRMARNQSAEVDRWVSAHVHLADTVGRDLVAYEGGQHLAGDPGNANLTRLFTSVNRSPRMGDLYDTYLSRWRAATDNSLMMHFSDVGPYSRFGSWGALETSDQAPSTSPKYVALLRFSGTDRVDPPPPTVPTAPPVPLPLDPPHAGTPPAVTAGMSIDGGRFTRSRSVVLSVRWPPDVTEAQVGDRSDFRGARTVSRAERVRWLLPRADRGVTRHRIFLRFVGSPDARTYSDRVMLDRARPQLRRVMVTPGTGSGARIRSVARDRGSGVVGMQVSSRGRTPITVPYARKVAIGVRRQAISIRVVDRAGNASRRTTVPRT